jgi:hypothetical protein
MKRLRRIALLLSAVTLLGACERSPSTQHFTRSKAEIFGLIANPDERETNGDDGVVVARWQSQISLSVVDLSSASDAAKQRKDVVQSLTHELNEMGLSAFPGVAMIQSSEKTNVLFLLGDDIPSLLAQVPYKDEERWSLLIKVIRDELAEVPWLTCGRAIGRDGAILGGALVVISTREGAGDPSNCIGTALADIVGLRGRSDLNASIKYGNVEDFTTLDREALSILYGADTSAGDPLWHHLGSYLR